MDRLRLEGVRVIWKNFRGESGVYNAAGERNFAVVIENLDRAGDLIQEGWNLKPLRNEEDKVDAYALPVKVNYVTSQTPPRIYKVSPSTGSQLALDERTVDMLDYLPIDYVDIIINPYLWSVNNQSGVKAYCNTMYAVIEENELDLKYANMEAEQHIGD